MTPQKLGIQLQLTPEPTQRSLGLEMCAFPINPILIFAASQGDETQSRAADCAWGNHGVDGLYNGIQAGDRSVHARRSVQPDHDRFRN